MTAFSREDMCVGRVVNEDDDFLLLEIPKRDDIPMHLDPETPDRFFTLLFVHQADGNVEVWKPWEAA